MAADAVKVNAKETNEQQGSGQESQGKAESENLKKAVNEGYFEALIRRYLLENPHGCILTLVPKKGLAAQREKELEEKLEAYRSSLSEEQLDAMVEKTKALEAYQEAGEDPKALECIPMLKRSDIKKEAAKIVNEELTVDNSLFLYHDVCTCLLYTSPSPRDRG